jgi:hypothetical protein
MLKVCSPACGSIGGGGNLKIWGFLLIGGMHFKAMLGSQDLPGLFVHEFLS